jgi:putative resolvase
MRGNETPFYKIGEVCEIFGVKPGILRRWAAADKIRTIKTPGGMHLYDISSLDPSLNKKTNAKDNLVTILYSRVSSKKQQDDLERQQEYLRSNLPDEYSRSEKIEVTDIGSGINFKRPGLLRILRLVKEGKVSTVVVASRDRMARFGFELIEWMCQEFGSKILVLDNEDTTPESELGKDLMSIVQVYCCRWNGKRRYQNKNQSPETKVAPNKGTESDVEPMGGLLQIPLQQDDRFINQQIEQDSKDNVQVKRQVGNNKGNKNQYIEQFLPQQIMVA